MKEISHGVDNNRQGYENESPRFRYIPIGESPGEGIEHRSSQKPKINAKTPSAHGKRIAKEKKRA